MPYLCVDIPRIAINAEEGGEGDEVEPIAESGEVLPFSSLWSSSCPSLLETLFEVEVATEAVEDEVDDELLSTVVVWSNSISRICPCLISSLESGIKYFRTY